jgi:hypothetical protein
MSAEDLCANCKHARAIHKNELVESDTNYGWPECDCKQFVE